MSTELVSTKEFFATNNAESFYKGFKYYWTGWKYYPDSIRITGQWIARDNNGNRFYSSVPGYCHDFYPGYVFNIAVLPHQVYLEDCTEESIKELEKDKGLELLKQVIDAIIEKQNNV